MWFKKKQTCSHCQKNRTKREFEDKPTCADCHIDILMEREPKKLCPTDGAVLAKSQKGEIIIDVCPKCSGIWLDSGELETIGEGIKQGAMSSGVAIGMIVG